MKKIFILFLGIFILLGCTNKQTVENENELSNEEKILLMINQCIDDYNAGVIKERETEWNTTINPLPIEITSIENIKTLNDLKEIDLKNSITSAVYRGSYKINNYSMIFDIYNYGNNFWLYGSSSFEIDIDSIVVNNPEFAETKEILDHLLNSNSVVLEHLYGVGVQLGNESLSIPGFYEVINTPDFPFTSIQEIKNEAEQIFTSDFLQSYYEIAFDKEDSIYKEIDGKLYCSEVDITLAQSLPYDTSRIIATKEEGNTLLIDIVITFGTDVSSELQRIVLVKTDAGYRLNNSY